jgi:hypothetical protein
MSMHHKMIVLAAAAALAVPATSGAQDRGFNYIEGGIVGGFVNDVGEASTFVDNGNTLELETDAGGGGFIGGAWQFSEHMHVFGEYSSASQDLEVRGGANIVEGDFDIARWRIGVGYAHALSSRTSLYSRLSYDSAELKDLQVAGFDLNASGDEDGLGAEVGVVWTASEAFELQGHVRYTAVGEIATEDSNTFDSDILVGVNGRWYFRPDIALFTSYELGKITTWRLGVRFDF